MAPQGKIASTFFIDSSVAADFFFIFCSRGSVLCQAVKSRFNSNILFMWDALLLAALVLFCVCWSIYLTCLSLKAQLKGDHVKISRKWHVAEVKCECTRQWFVITSVDLNWKNVSEREEQKGNKLERDDIHPFLYPDLFFWWSFVIRTIYGRRAAVPTPGIPLLRIQMQWSVFFPMRIHCDCRNRLWFKRSTRFTRLCPSAHQGVRNQTVQTDLDWLNLQAPVYF